MPVTLSLQVPLSVVLTFPLSDGETLTVTAEQATSSANLNRETALAPKRSFGRVGDDEDLGGIDIITPTIRSMYDVYYSHATCDIQDEEGNLLIPPAATLAQLRRVWGLPAMSERVHVLRGDEMRGKVSYHQMILEAVYQANPTWDPFLDEDTGESSRQLFGYGKKD